MKSSLKTVVFDFDGTLADTLYLCISAYQETAEEFLGTRLSREHVESFFGLNDTGVLAGTLGLSTDAPDLPLRRLIEIYKQLHPSLAPSPFEGVASILAQLKELGFRLALITGKEALTAEPSLDFYKQRGYFDWFGYGRAGYNAKTDLLRELMVDFNQCADELIYIGDAPSDITSSHDVGVRIINAAWAPDSALYQTDCLRLKPDFRLNDLSHLVPLLASLR